MVTIKGWARKINSVRGDKRRGKIGGKPFNSDAQSSSVQSLISTQSHMPSCLWLRHKDSISRWTVSREGKGSEVYPEEIWLWGMSHLFSFRHVTDRPLNLSTWDSLFSQSFSLALVTNDYCCISYQ